jgi:LuxR family transcriptional regulator, maltose regulon positive regulatory protein
LLAEWASQSPRPFAWVSADEGDNDPIVFLTYVAAALDRVSPLDPGVLEALASPGVSVEATAVPRLGAALAALDHPVVLVVDDLHVLRDRTCTDAIAALALHVPEGSQLVLSGRGGPILAPGTLRAKGLASEIGPADLSMDATDARELMHAAAVDLEADEVAELNDRIEGWSAGLYLAALSMRAGGLKTSRARRFSGGDRLMSEYLWYELLATLPERDIRFLRRTSVLERLSGPLCDAILEDTGSAGRLVRTHCCSRRPWRASARTPLTGSA